MWRHDAVTDGDLRFVVNFVGLWCIGCCSTTLVLALTDQRGPFMGTIAKAVVAFFALLVTNLVTNLTATGFVFPHNVSGWLAFLGTTIVGTFGVWWKANSPFRAKV